MAGGSCGAIDVYDGGNGSLTVAWPAFPGIAPASYNVYVNGVLNQNVVAPAKQATITGLKGASYSGSTITQPTTYTIAVRAVVAGVEVAASLDRAVTVQPTSVMLTTPMARGPFPFPSTPGGF